MLTLNYLILSDIAAIVLIYEKISNLYHIYVYSSLGKDYCIVRANFIIL